jgi:hypothetical protein
MCLRSIVLYIFLVERRKYAAKKANSLLNVDVVSFNSSRQSLNVHIIQ